MKNRKSDRLKYLQKLFEEANNENTNPEHLKQLFNSIYYYSDEIKQALISNPNTPLDILFELGEHYPSELLENPALDLLSNLNLLMEMPEETLISILILPQVPQEFITFALNNRKTLNVLMTIISYQPRLKKDLKDVKLCGVDLTGAKLIDADLRRADLTGVDLTGAKLIDADLRCANLTGANLTDANLIDANLTGADLRCANLTGADLRCSNSTDANLIDANLTGADLRYANLTGADLTGANLTNTLLVEADLKNADLTSANLTNSNLEDVKLSENTIINSKWLDNIK